MSDFLCDVQRRHDFVLLFDVQDGNPNGDPDAGNLPRVDPETMHGLVTDVCLKRKVRNYVDLVQGGQPGYRIYVQNRGVALNTLHREAYAAKGIKSTGTKQNTEDVARAREWMCETFFDIRTFGAVMTTGVNCGQVRGPAQLTFARSVDPVFLQEVAITRVAITKEDGAKYVAADGYESATGGKLTEMGRKAILPYALYRAFGFINPSLAEQTKFSPEDLALFWRSLREMWDIDRSAGRGLMASRGLFVFSHASKYGNAPADQLFSLVTDRISKLPKVSVPRRVQDYVLPSTAGIQDAMNQAGITNVTVSNLVPPPAQMPAPATALS